VVQNLAAASDSDFAGLQLLGNLLHEVNGQETIRQTSRCHLDVVSQTELAFKGARRDAAVQIVAARAVVLAAARDGEDALVDRLDVTAMDFLVA